jgi:hypothetical protein
MVYCTLSPVLRAFFNRCCHRGARSARRRFLQRKVREYEMLKGEIEKLRQEVSERS